MQRIFFCDTNPPPAVAQDGSRGCGCPPLARAKRQHRGVAARVNWHNRNKLILAIVLALASVAMYVSVFLKVGGG